MRLKTVFMLSKQIPFCSILPGATIVKVGDIYYHDGAYIPFMTDSLVDQYCLKKEVYVPEYSLGSNCVVQIGSNFYGCLICSFNEISGKYTVKYKANGESKWEYDVPEDRLKHFEEYYFLSSSGIVQRDYLYRDIETENWRKKVGNFFLDKKDCQAYKESIINNSKTT